MALGVQCFFPDVQSCGFLLSTDHKITRAALWILATGRLTVEWIYFLWLNKVIINCKDNKLLMLMCNRFIIIQQCIQKDFPYLGHAQAAKTYSLAYTRHM